MAKEWKLDKSVRMFAEARKILPMGVTSNVRLWERVSEDYMPCAIYIERGEGSHIWDIDGNEYIDYRLGFGPVLLGHGYKAVDDRVREASKSGIVFALSEPMMVEVAKRIKSMVPCAEMVRFCNSGTEATMAAIRVARAFTGKDKIVKFEGHYHGVHDNVMFSVEPELGRRWGEAPRVVPMSTGIPKAMEKLVVVQRWNDFSAMEKTVEEEGDHIAAIITEPVMGNCAAITPRKGYLDFLRQLCDEHNIVLIFDEVKTGFRLAPGGAQKVYGVEPDLATYAKAMGNGYPVGAFAGKRELMELIGPKKVMHGGTYVGNTLAMAATAATLDELKGGDVHRRLDDFGKGLMKGISDILTDAGARFVMNGFPTMFQFLFTELPAVHEYRDMAQCNWELFATLQGELLKRGVMADEDCYEPWFTSYSHTNEDLGRTLEALKGALPAALAPRGETPTPPTERSG